MSKQTNRQAEIAEAKERLLGWIKPGDTIYTILDHISASGMTRRIRLVVPQVCEDGQIRFIHPNHSAAKLLGYRQDMKRGGLIVSGCGMDMGFHVIYSLSRELFRDGFICTGKGCHSNDHTNGDRNYQPHAHSDSGYALRQEWL